MYISKNRLLICNVSEDNGDSRRKKGSRLTKVYGLGHPVRKIGFGRS